MFTVRALNIENIHICVTLNTEPWNEQVSKSHKFFGYNYSWKQSYSIVYSFLKGEAYIWGDRSRYLRRCV